MLMLPTFCEISVNFFTARWLIILEDIKLHICRCEDLKSEKNYTHSTYWYELNAEMHKSQAPGNTGYLILLGLQYDTCSMSVNWRLEFLGG